MSKMLSLWIAAVALGLLACTQPQQPAAPAPDQGGAPKFGGVLNTYGEELTDFDMVYQGKTSENTIDHSLVYDTLLNFKKGPDLYMSQVLEPQLAERWEVSSDGRTFTYYLRKGVKFANIPPVNGRELTSADVKWSMEYYSRTGEYFNKGLPVSQMTALFGGMDIIETPDRNTVRVRFSESFVPFLNYSASRWMPIAARETYKTTINPPRIDTLVGTGPYMLDSEGSQKGTRWVFKKNPTYWDAPKPYLDAIRRLIIADVSTRSAAFQVKQLDILNTVPTYDGALQIKQANPDAVVFETLTPAITIMYISQLKAGPTRDPRVRKAISLAMDRDEYNKVMSGGKGAWLMSGGWPELFTDAEAHKLLRTDIPEAKRLLAEAGFPNGLKLEYLAFNNGDVAEQLLQSQLKRAGIDVSFLIFPREINRPMLYNGEFDLFHPGGGAIGDADFDAWQYMYHSESSLNWSKVNDPELDKLIMAQRREANPEKRREAQRAVVMRIHEMSWNPGYINRVLNEFWHPYVKGYYPHFAIGQKDAFAWLDK